MPGLKLHDYEEAYVQLEENGQKYYLKEFDAELIKKVSAYHKKALEGDRDAMEAQMHLLTGIPKDKLSKMGQWKLNAISQYCVEMNIERKKKGKKQKKSG